MPINRPDAIDDALERLYELGFTMEHSFSEHGPMVAEAISTLGRNDRIACWVETYKAKHDHAPAPPRQAPIDGRRQTDWRNALGDYARTTDWLEFFRRKLDEQPWQNTIELWVPLLIPGYFGGLTHGLIRTAHAVRAFAANGVPSRLQTDELARGLAYWAGTYRELPGDPHRHGALSLDEALQQLPRVAPGDKGGPRPGALRDLPGFTDTVESRAEAAAVEEAINRHAAAFARVLISHPEVPPIPLVHAITAPTAMQNLLSCFEPEFGVRVYDYLWQVSAAIVALFAPAQPRGEMDPEIAQPTLSPGELVDRAIEHGDEHTIKLTEACLREDRIRPDPVYRAAAEAVLKRTPPLA